MPNTGKTSWWSRTPEVRSAWQEFMRGCWDVPGNRTMLSQAMRQVWDSYRDEGRYTELLARLREANGRDAAE